MGLPSWIISLSSCFPILTRAFSTRCLVHPQKNRASILSVISGSIPESRFSRICAGPMPSSRSEVTEEIPPILSSRVPITSSDAPGISWIINPPACLTVLSLFISTPRATLEGVCSEVA